MSTTPHTVRTTDYHAAGEPFRIVDEDLPPVPGDTVAERRATALGPGGSGTDPRPGPLDDLRRLLSREPRGHAGMYGGFIVPPDDDGAHFGVLFWHKDGYSTACGHGTMALGAWAVDTGRVPAPHDGDVPVRIDVPSGRVTATVHRADGRTTGVTFRNVPARVLARKVPVATTLGTVDVDIADSGACYVSVPARALGLGVTVPELPELVRAGREIRAALPAYDVYGVILHEELSDTPEGPAQRNVTVFADGQIDRSPCGSGTSARLVLLGEDGRLVPGETLRHESVVGTVFTGRLLDGGITEVTGTTHRTGSHAFHLDPHDDLGAGFLL
ncbi:MULTISPECIES: proline racemase family protein [unclassified Streptomyces]|uniref:proline racemase family protein n=1 Tax=unclassified Streptomyces TaxID=2593676 RepID=UPI0006FAB4E0|nr:MULTISPECIES: proline racemase family protein [unclassified Streptomyces]KQX57015.1 proline racemase [Streptomyces sp. Root1304]KRA98596.1 proline racemase [Streptomyces sp. Root66D1]